LFFLRRLFFTEGTSESSSEDFFRLKMLSFLFFPFLNVFEQAPSRVSGQTDLVDHHRILLSLSLDPPLFSEAAILSAATSAYPMRVAL